MVQLPLLAQLLRRFCPLRRNRSGRTDWFAPVLLERLEDRCVPAAVQMVWAASELEIIYAASDEVAPTEEDTSEWQIPADGTVVDDVFTNPDFGQPPAGAFFPDMIWDGRENGPVGGGQEASAVGSESRVPATLHEFSPPATLAEVPQVAAPRPQFIPSLVDEGTLRLTRGVPVETDVAVRYTVTAFSSGGAATRESTITLPAGVAHVDVPLPRSHGETEIVTVQMQDAVGTRPATPAVTLFVQGQPEVCCERALLEAYQNSKSPLAFDALVQRNRPGVIRSCYQILRNWHDAEDASQMVFLALAQAQVRIQTGLAGWLRTVARNTSLLLVRSTTRRNRHEQRAARPAIIHEDTNRELREELDVALGQLAEPVREAVRLRYLEGWSQNEAAQLLGCPRGTLSQRASLGIRHLRGILNTEQ